MSILIAIAIMFVIVTVILSAYDSIKKFKSEEKKHKTKAEKLGDAGEREVQRLLMTLPYNKYKVMRNIMINTYNGGTTQIDFLVVSLYGIFVIEVKNYSGTVFGKYNSQNWKQCIGKNTYEFYNPLKQNDGHVNALSKLLKINKDRFIPITVFSNKTNIKAPKAIHQRNIIKNILSYKEKKLHYSELEPIVMYINDNNIDSAYNRKRHINNINRYSK